jgi:hypothetical protein
MKQYQSVIEKLNLATREKRAFPLIDELMKVSARPAGRDVRQNEFLDCWKILDYLLRPYAGCPPGHLEGFIIDPLVRTLAFV